MIKPLNKRIVIQMPEVKEVSDGGILLTQSKCQTRQQTGKVLAVGPEVSVVEVGQEIAINHGQFQLIDEKYVDNLTDCAIITEEDVIGIFE